MKDLTHRHDGTQAVARHFAYEHLRPQLQPYSKPFHDLAEHMTDLGPDGPELTFALRQLLLAKDAFVRVGVDALATR